MRSFLNNEKGYGHYVHGQYRDFGDSDARGSCRGSVHVRHGNPACSPRIGGLGLHHLGDQTDHRLNAPRALGLLATAALTSIGLLFALPTHAACIDTLNVASSTGTGVFDVRQYANGIYRNDEWWSFTWIPNQDILVNDFNFWNALSEATSTQITGAALHVSGGAINETFTSDEILTTSYTTSTYETGGLYFFKNTEYTFEFARVSDPIYWQYVIDSKFSYHYPMEQFDFLVNWNYNGETTITSYTDYSNNNPNIEPGIIINASESACYDYESADPLVTPLPTSTYDGSYSELLPSVSFGSSTLVYAGGEFGETMDSIFGSSTWEGFPMCFVSPWFGFIDILNGATKHQQNYQTIHIDHGFGSGSSTELDLSAASATFAGIGLKNITDILVPFVEAVCWLLFGLMVWADLFKPEHDMEHD